MEIIKNNKQLADNELKDIDSRIKITNEDILKNKEKQVADHAESVKLHNDLDAKTVNADANVNAKLTKHTEDTQKNFNEKQDSLNKQKESFDLHKRETEDKFKDTIEKANQENRVTHEYAQSLKPMIDKLRQFLDMD